MSELSPGPSCNRHVRVADPVCPFCAAALPARAAAAGRALPRGRLSRAAIFAAGATLAGMAACTDTSNNPADGGAGGAGANDGAAAAGGAAGGSAGSGGATGGAGGRGDADAGVDGPVAI